MVSSCEVAFSVTSPTRLRTGGAEFTQNLFFIH
jgi:hypothetical protein